MKFMKKIAVAISCVFMIVATTACQNADLTWAAKQNDITMSIGAYTYYQVVAYDEAAALVPSDIEVLSAEIDGKPATQWIEERTMEYVERYFWIEEKVLENGFELTEEEVESAKSISSQNWEYYSQTMDSLGISEESFNNVSAQYDIKSKKVFDFYYGDGGEYEIPKEELIEYYINGKYSYAYTYVPLTATNEDGQIREVTEDEEQEIVEMLERYKTQIETGYTSVDVVSQEIAMLKEYTEPLYVADITDLKYEYYPTNFVETLDKMEKGEVEVFESEGNMMLLQKFNIEADAEMMYQTAHVRLGVMIELKGEEFEELAFDLAKESADSIELNQAGIDSVKIENVVTDSNKFGTAQ